MQWPKAVVQQQLHRGPEIWLAVSLAAAEAVWCTQVTFLNQQGLLEAGIDQVRGDLWPIVTAPRLCDLLADPALGSSA